MTPLPAPAAQMCCETRWRNWRHVPCGKAAKIERDGKWYCGMHDPVAKKKRDDARAARNQAAFEESQREFRAERLKRESDAHKVATHAALLAALERAERDLVHLLDKEGVNHSDIDPTVEAARAAIRAARGEG